MHVVIAPNAFKESLSAMEVANAIASGLKSILPSATIDTIPIADGGDGTLEALVTASHGQLYTIQVSDPLGRQIAAKYGVIDEDEGKTAVIEMAQASGLRLLGANERNPSITSTFGSGELILASLKRGCRKVIIGLGGSATNDGGSGALAALGVKFLKQDGSILLPGGAALRDLARLDLTELDKAALESKYLIACDVDNPLTGTKGASAIYGPQKGATPAQVKELDLALSHFADVLERTTGKDVRCLPGCGAAGGFAAGFLSILQGELRPGFEIVAQALKIEERIKQADLVITGEGELNAQSRHGKGPVGIAMIAAKYHIPVIAIVGNIAADHQVVYKDGITSTFSIAPGPISMADCIRDAKSLLNDTAQRIARLLKVTRIGKMERIYEH